VSKVVNIYRATDNLIEVIFIETEQGRAILGVVDGFRSKGMKTEKDVEERKHFLRKIGYIECIYTRNTIANRRFTCGGYSSIFESHCSNSDSRSCGPVCYT
jgi:hypothetical protein